MIVWLSKEVTGRPNNQRAEIQAIHAADGLITVKMCGDHVYMTVNASGITSVEIGDLMNSITLEIDIKRITRQHS